MVRQPMFAGSFYPADPRTLRAMVVRFLDEARDHVHPGTLRALVAPHAGYVYSGPIAGSAYRLARDMDTRPGRVLLLGPAHRVAFGGMALTGAKAFATPLGEVEIDPGLRDAVQGLPEVQELEVAHAEEHSLEVQLPFLQVALGSCSVLPMVVGQTGPGEVSAVIEACLAACPGTLVVVSSDLSHYLSYERAVAKDRETAARVVDVDSSIRSDCACGSHPLMGLLATVRKEGWTMELLDLRNSGDTAGDRDRVVGYGAFAAWGEP